MLTAALSFIATLVLVGVAARQVPELFDKAVALVRK
jgi:hypothetical protein